MFKGSFSMNDPCPVCGLIFHGQCEEGLLPSGAMYFSYFLGVGILGPFFFVLSYLLPAWDGVRIAFLSLVLYLPFIPAVFR